MSLVIRDEQTEALEASLKDRFAVELAAELRQEHTEAVEPYNDKELHNLILEGVDRAESYELDSDSDVGAFVKLLFVVGWYFDRYPLFHHFFTEEDYEGHERLEYLFDAATEEDWKKAAAQSGRLLEEE